MIRLAGTVSSSGKDVAVNPSPSPSVKPSQEPASVTKSVPKVSKVRSLKAKAGKKRLTVTWRAASGVDGYQLQVSTKKSFKGAKKYKVHASGKKYVVKKLKARKKYYVRIRAYKSYTSSGNKRQMAYGKWTKVRKKTK